MSAQPSLLAKAETPEVILPSNDSEVQVVRDRSAFGFGRYWAYFKNGAREFIGGPEVDIRFVQYNNNSVIVPNNDTLVEIPLSIATLEIGSTIDNRVVNRYKIPKTGLYELCLAIQQADNQNNPAFIALTFNKNGFQYKASQISIDLSKGLYGSLSFTQVFQENDILDFFALNNKDNNTILFNFQTAIVLLKNI